MKPFLDALLGISAAVGLCVIVYLAAVLVLTVVIGCRGDREQRP